VPTLVLEDGTAIGEVPAITGVIFARRFPKALLGATPRQGPDASGSDERNLQTLLGQENPHAP